jgi:hypothetical protein
MLRLDQSDKDPDWPQPTTASANWQGSAWSNGDPLALEGTTVAVDFNRIPRGSLIYIPSLNMYAEANDTGATRLWSQQDFNQSDYGLNGAGRIDFITRPETGPLFRLNATLAIGLGETTTDQSMLFIGERDGNRELTNH